MKQIIKNIYHVGDNECSVYMVDTQSDQGLVLIDHILKDINLRISLE